MWAGNDFHRPLSQALLLTSHVRLEHWVLSYTHFFQAPATQARVSETDELLLQNRRLQ